MSTSADSSAFTRAFSRLNGRFPWRRVGSRDQLVVAWSGQMFVYVLARWRADGVHEVVRCGVERQGSDSMGAFISRLQNLRLKCSAVHVMLWAEQYQLLQIDAPGVAPEEMRAAARYQIRELLHSHVDDATLDVMRVGDSRQTGGGQIFVVAVPNVVLRDVIALCDAVQWNINVIDIQETAQRNLQSALAKIDGYPERANAALILVDGHAAVLTICANDELFFSRRLESPEDLLATYKGPDHNATGPPAAVAPVAAAGEKYLPVGEYVPDYRVGGVAYGSDYSNLPVAVSAPLNVNSAIDEKMRRFVTEVDRSIDTWSRSWSSLPLHEIRVHIAGRTNDLCAWLSTHLAHKVTPLAVGTLFPGFERAAGNDAELCLPLLGVLLRTETPKA